MAQSSHRPAVRRARHEPPPTLATVADEAGVSRQTVSNALNNPELLRPETLTRVREVIDRLGYSPNRAARQLRTRSSHLLGLRFEQAQEGTSNALMDRFLHSLVEEVSRTGHHVLLFSGDPEDPLDGYDDLLRSTAVDAFVVTDTYAGTPQAGFLQSRGAPFVAFGRPWDDPDATHAWVDVDGAHGARVATEHLREQGHQRIAWLGWDRSSRLGEDRRAGWKAAMAGSGEDLRALSARIDDDLDAARLAAHRLLDEAGATGFVCASDTLAIGVLHACAERDLRPGPDVGVVGFDDSLAAQVTWPGLSSVRQPLEEVAVELVRVLHLVLAHKPIGERGLLLPPRLVVRRSSQRS
jgi:LacI family transcriptional regulator